MTIFFFKYQNDEMIWFERPLSEHLYEEMAQSVKYLLQLRLIQLKLILVDLTQVTNIFMSSLRDKQSDAYQKIEPHIVPFEIQKLTKKSVNNHIDLYDPYITYSRDSIRIVKK